MTLVLSYWILFLLIGIVTFAFPKVRSVAHDKFERTHRFLGWTATAFVWAQVVSLINDYRAPGQSLGHALVMAPPFWLVCVLTMSIILPWIRLRKVPVRADVLSNHAVRLYFDYGKYLLQLAAKSSSLTTISSNTRNRNIHSHLQKPAHGVARFRDRSRTRNEGLLSRGVESRGLD